MAKQRGAIGRTYDRLGSTLDNTFGIVDEGSASLRVGLSVLNPMAQELLNDANADLNESKISYMESVVKLAKAKKSYADELIAIGLSQAEVADIMANI